LHEVKLFEKVFNRFPYRIRSDKMIKVDKSKCIKCGGCVSVCPKGALELNDEINCDETKCIECGICIKFCPVGALSLAKVGKNEYK